MELKFEDLTDVVVTGKVVGVRVDFNVPIINGIIQDVSRIRNTAKTVQFLRENGAKIVLFSHLGRPKGIINKDLSLANIVDTVSAIFGSKVYFVKKIEREIIQGTINQADFGEIVLLENLRFYKGEEENSQDFADIIGDFLNIYINESFSCSHRKHASIDAITNKVRSVSGFALEREVKELSRLFDNKNKKICAILGGAKVSTKLFLLEHLCKYCDTIYLGGGMANTLLKYNNVNIGSSMHEAGMEDDIVKFTEKAKQFNCNILLPTDFSVIDKQENIYTRSSIKDIQNGDKIFDIGPKTVDSIKESLLNFESIIMNGPMGMYEQEPFHKGTLDIIDFISRKTKEGKIKQSVAGGGDIVACINKYHIDGFSFTSDAGGAFLEFISGIELPGIKALISSKERFQKDNQ